MNARKNRRGLRRLSCFVFIIFFAMAWSFNASAKPKSFDALVRTAAKAYEDSKFDTALEHFEAAYAMKAETALLYNMGRSCEGKADFPCAVAYYTRFVSSPDVEHASRVDAVDRIRTLNEVMALQGLGPATTAPSPGMRPASNTAMPQAMVAARPISHAAPAGCVDVNTANESELIKLKRIGPSKAKAILDSRNTEGLFRSIDDLSRVKGIGPKTIEGFRDTVCPIDANTQAVSPAVSHQGVQSAQPMPQPEFEAKPHPKRPIIQKNLNKGTTAVIDL